MPGTVLLLHVVSLVVLAGVVPLTSDESHYLAAGMALRGELDFSVRYTVLQGPLPLHANQLGPWIAGLLGHGSGAEAVLDGPGAAGAEGALWQGKFLGRLGMIGFSIVTFLVLMRWSGTLFGPLAAGAAGFLYACNPLVLGHGCLMTADMAMTAGFTVALWCTHRYVVGPTATRAASLGVALGAALATKYLAVLLVPSVAITVVGCHVTGSAVARGWRVLPDGLLCAALALVTLHACYGFSVPRFALETAALDPSGTFAKTIDAVPGTAALISLLPEPFVRGMDFQMTVGRTFQETRFLGEVHHGHPAYYVTALATKLPAAFLLLCGIGVAAAWRRAYRWPATLAWTVVPASLLLVGYLSLFTSLQIGVRYVLPVIPLLVLWSLQAVTWLWKEATDGRWILAALAVWSLCFAGWHWPRFIGAYNEITATEPYVLFGDSNTDWQHAPPRDPAIVALHERHPDAAPVRYASGPRFGTVLVYALDLWPPDPVPEGPVYHWLLAFDPVDREGAFYVFSITEAGYRERLERLRSRESGNATSTTTGREQHAFARHRPRVATPGGSARVRRELAIALLGEGRVRAARLLFDGFEAQPDLVEAMELLAKLSIDPAPDPALHRRLIDLWRTFGRFDLVLRDEQATPGQRAHAYFMLGNYAGCRQELEPEMQDRRLSMPDMLILCVSQVREHEIELALQTLQRHMPPTGTAEHAEFQTQIDELKSLLADRQVLRRQITKGHAR